jgi:hypothetical protein
VEIAEILNTQERHRIQIIAKDIARSLLIVVVWDLDQNIECSMFQMKMEKNTKPENYLVKGMNEKYNYFFNQNFIIDLEYNIPIQKVNKVSMRSKTMNKKWRDQRKIFDDGSKYLNIEEQHKLQYAYTRRDLAFWRDIEEQGNNVKLIEDNSNLDQFMQIFCEYSLFHKFAENVDIIEMIHRKFKTALDD